MLRNQDVNYEEVNLADELIANGSFASLIDFLNNRVKESEDSVLFEYFEDDDSPNNSIKVTAKEFDSIVDKAATLLTNNKVKKGDYFPYIASARFQTAVIVFAIARIGAVAVPVYPSASEQQISNILAIAFESKEDSNKVVYAFNEEEHTNFLSVPGIKVLHFQDVENSAFDIEFAYNLNHSLDDQAVLIFTSGTNSNQVPVHLTNRQVVSNCISTIQNIYIRNEIDLSRVLFHLPLAHIMPFDALFFGMGLGSVISFCPKIQNIVKFLKAFQPSWILSAPKVIEKSYMNISINKPAGFKGFIFEKALNSAIKNGERNSTENKLYSFFDKKVYSKIREVFGGSLKHIFCGGQKSDTDLVKLFWGIGIEYFDCYGMSEAGGTICLVAKDYEIGTVGKPLKIFDLRIKGNSEIILAGHSNSAIESDLKTGDLGEFDKFGNVKITGREKDIIITSGGKNISPDVIEKSLAAFPLVDDAVIIGENRPYLGALIWLDESAVKQLRKQNDFEVDSVEESSYFDKQVEYIIEKNNKRFSKPERIKRFIIMQEKEIDNSETTPSLKKRRNYIIEKYKDKIDEMIYGK